MMMRISLLALSLCVALVSPGCDKEKTANSEPKKSAAGKSPEADKGATAKKGGEHGAEKVLGKATVGGFELEVSRLGAITAGADSAVAAKVLKSPAGKDWKTVNLYVWVEDAEGSKINAPEKAHVEDGRLHAHAEVPAGAKSAPANIVLRLRDASVDERVKVSLGTVEAAASPKKASHEHEKTPHDGLVAALNEGDKQVGWLELKLHDDAGDLELWLATDKAFKTPLDLPADAAITVTFVDHGNKQVKLAPRDRDTNPDDDRKPQMRHGKTNYFVFPGATGQDASWLKGLAFESIVNVAISAGQRTLTGAEFVLKPHAPHDEKTP